MPVEIMISFRDLVESMENDILENEHAVVTSGAEPRTPIPGNVPIKQEPNLKRESSIVPQLLKDVGQDPPEEAEENTINNHEIGTLSQNTNTRKESMNNRRQTGNTVKCGGKQTSGYDVATLEGTRRETQTLSHARNEYVTDTILKHECQHLPLTDQDQECLDEEPGFLVKTEDDDDCEVNDHADQHLVANEGELSEADQEFVSHGLKFPHADHGDSYEYAGQGLVSSVHDPQEGCVIKEECCTVMKEEKIDNDDNVTEESIEEDATQDSTRDPTEPTWVVAHTPHNQQTNLLTSFHSGMGHNRLHTTHAASPRQPRSSTNTIASASKVGHSPNMPRAEILYTSGTRPLSSISDNADQTIQAKFSNTKGTREGGRERALHDGRIGAHSVGSRPGGGRGQGRAGEGDAHNNTWNIPQAQRTRHAPGRSSTDPCVSACRDGGLSTASLRGVRGLLSLPAQATRGWRHLRNRRYVEQNPDTQEIRWCDRGDAGSTTSEESRATGVEGGHTLGAPGPHALTTHDNNGLSSKRTLRHSRGSKTSHLRKAAGRERQGSDRVAAAGVEQQGSAADPSSPHPAQQPPVFRCEVCKTTRRDAGSLVRHWRLHAPARPFACSDCPSRFNQLVHLQIHRRTHTGEKPFRCDTCGFRFSRKDRLRCHERSHSGELPYPCPDCEATFRDVASLKVHLATHARHTPHTCRICHATFAQLSTFTSHWRRHNWGKTLQEHT